MTTRILLIAHAPLAQALRDCALHVFADCGASVLALDVPPQAAPEDTLAQARHMLQPLGDAPLLVLTDVFGATPSNVATRLAELASDLKLKVVAGVNLPMLLRSVCYQDESLDALAARATAGAIQGVIQVTVNAPQQQSLRSPAHAATHHSSQQ